MMRALKLVKGEHTLLLTYEPGTETTVLDYLAQLPRRNDSPFDWFDVAILSHQLGQQLAAEIKGFLPKGNNAKV